MLDNVLKMFHYFVIILWLKNSSQFAFKINWSLGLTVFRWRARKIRQNKIWVFEFLINSSIHWDVVFMVMQHLTHWLPMCHNRSQSCDIWWHYKKSVRHWWTSVNIPKNFRHSWKILVNIEHLWISFSILVLNSMR